MSKEKQFGPIFGVELIDEFSHGCGLDGELIQAMPSRQDLEAAAVVSERTVAGYETLLGHWRNEKAEKERLTEENAKLRNYIASIEPQLQFFPDLTPSMN